MKKFILWLGAVSPVLYTVLAGVIVIDPTKIAAGVFLTVSIIAAVLFLILISQHCWERMKQE